MQDERQPPEADDETRDRRPVQAGEVAFDQEETPSADGSEKALPARGDERPPAHQGPRVGDRLGGRYRILRVLGRGGWGTVYVVEHRVTRVHLAAKLLHTHCSDVEQRDRFLREPRLLMQVGHPHVVRVLDCDHHEGHPFFTMELLDGLDLKEWLTAHGPQPLARVVAMLRGPADALDRLHAQHGLVHRDIKPSNLFVGADGTVKLLDFGVCHVEEGLDLTRASAAPCTLGYAAPEQRDGEAVDRRADVYALATVACELLTGRRPPKVPSGQPCACDKGDGTEPELLPAVCDVLRRARHGDPRVRHGSATALLDDLGRLVPVAVTAESAEPSGATDAVSPAAAAPPRPMRIYRRIHVVLGLALLAAAAGLVVWLTREPPSDVAAPSTAPLRSNVVLAVLPLAAAPDTTDFDALIWSFAHRIVANAFEADERWFGRLRRIDPALFDANLAWPPNAMTPGEGERIARERGARYVLDGEVGRAPDGAVAIRAWLAGPLGTRQALDVKESTLVAAAGALAGKVRAILWGAAPPGASDAQRRAVWVASTATLDGLATLSPSLARKQRLELLDGLAEADDDSLAPLWLRYFEKLDELQPLAKLAQRAQALGDADLAGYFAAMAKDPRGVPCDGDALVELGARHATMLGELAKVVCLHRQGQRAKAVDVALGLLHQNPHARALARGYLLQNVGASRSCSEQLEQRGELWKYAPEQVTLWSSLALWRARCPDRPSDPRAAAALELAKALAGLDPLLGEAIASHLASVALLQGDAASADEPVGALERQKDRGADDYRIPAMLRHLKGRPTGALQMLRDGLATACVPKAAKKGDGLDTASAPKAPKDCDDLAYALAFALVAEARSDGGEPPAALLDEARGDGGEPPAALLDEAERVATWIEENHPGPEDAFGADMIRLAIEEAASGRANDPRRADLVARARADGVSEEQLRAQQSAVLALRADGAARAACCALVESDPTLLEFVGGCRFRCGELRLDEKRTIEAAEHFRTASREIVWTLLGGDQLLAAMLGEGRAAEEAGDAAAACRAFARIDANAEAGTVVPEVVAARDGLRRLACSSR